MSARHSQRGISLIEMMIAMVIGLMLISSAIMVFSGTRRSSELNQTLSQMQEGGRFAIDSILRDVRMAGFQGCATSSAMIRGNDAPTTDLSATALVVSTIDAAGTWTPGAPLGWVPPAAGVSGTPVPGTHAVSVQFGGPDTWTIAPMASTASAVTVTDAASNLVSGDLALIADCQVADIFRISANNGVVLQHSAAMNGDDSRLSAQYGLTTPLFPISNARVMRFESNIYYIGNTQRTRSDGTAVYALYRQSLPYDADNNPPLEMIEGVEHLKVRAGVRNGASGIEYMNPEDTAGMTQNIRVLQIGLLLKSPESVLDQNETQQFRIADTVISSDAAYSTTTYKSDKRLRIAFNASVAVRNRYGSD